jgi:hypothetical protein
MATDAESGGTDTVRILGDEVARMARFAIENGKPLSEESARSLAPGAPRDVVVLARIHAELARSIAPVTPTSLRGAADGRWLVIRMGWSAVAVVLGFIALKVAPEIAPAGLAPWLWSLHDHLGVAAAALLGAMFYNVYKAQNYVATTTYDPAYNTTYWNRLVVGVLAGMVLSLVADGTGEASASASVAPAFSRELLALLGGYSAEAVSQILDRLVEAAKTLVAGRAEDASQAQLAARQAELAAEAKRRQLGFAGEIVKFEQDLAAPLTAEARAKLAQLVAGLTGS